ncbi:MAG: M48 family metallopeptidase, partial [Hyphomicrobiales bacterium]|nr:M48 family metallopeptidase [Hyphomicrobiales bacterium]
MPIATVSAVTAAEMGKTDRLLMRKVIFLTGLLLTGCATAPLDGVIEGTSANPASGQMSAGGTTLASPHSAGRAPAPAAGRSSGPPDLSKLQHYRHPAAEAMLRDTLADLLRAAGNGRRLDVSPHVAILDSPSYNAVLQGNRLYVTRGMLAMLNDRSELAAILAHELGHLIAGHARHRIAAREQAVAAAVDIAMTFRDPELTRRAVAAQKLSLAAFSREQEYEADRISVALMARAGYDPQGAIRSLLNYERVAGLFGRLTRLSPDRKVMRAMSAGATHPPTPERIARSRRQVASLGRNSGGKGGRTG